MGTVVVSTVAAPVARADFEKRMFRGVELGLVGWERSHSQGAGTGKESPHGILYAPSEVNQQLQNKGVEQFMRDFFKVKAKEVELILTTDTTAWPGTLRLKCIDYKFEAKRGSVRRTLFEASIEVANSRVKPAIKVSAEKYSDWEAFMTPLKPKK